MAKLKRKKEFIRLISYWDDFLANAAAGRFFEQMHRIFNNMEHHSRSEEFFYPENKQEVINLIKLSAKNRIQDFVQAYLYFMEPIEKLEWLRKNHPDLIGKL